jgi:hypothetical protein
MIYLPPWIGPGSELQIAQLVVEREPGDVDLAGALEDPRRDVKALPVIRNDDICLKGTVKLLIRTVTRVPLILHHQENIN